MKEREKILREMKRRAEEGEDLIPGLPDDIALDCLARVPHRFHPGLRLVSRRWSDLLTAPSFYRRRCRIGTAEDLVFLVQALLPLDTVVDATAGDVKEPEEEEKGGATACQPPVYGLSLYNATDGSWHRVVTVEPLPLFAQVAVVERKLVVMGGWDPASFEPVAEVRVLDLGTGQWRQGAAMRAARSFFACAAVDGSVYVAGGHDGQKNALRTAEAYDAAADEWVALPAMAEERDECKGLAAEGRFWAVSGYGTERQGEFGEEAEWYDAAAGEWRKEERVWDAQTEGGAACVAVAEGRMWSLECGFGGGGGRVQEYEGRGKGWREVAQLPEGMRSSLSPAAMGGGRERVFVMAAERESGPHRGWVLEVGSKNWTRVETPSGFSGFVYSAAAVRI